ncbi:hypothetical protein [Micropruina sp.]|uniref:hypothetical protein n=1 Tax=Micropruina sp. TaxID=2737536 RepID=UPI0039E47130
MSEPTTTVQPDSLYEEATQATVEEIETGRLPMGYSSWSDYLRITRNLLCFERSRINRKRGHNRTLAERGVRRLAAMETALLARIAANAARAAQ